MNEAAIFTYDFDKFDAHDIFAHVREVPHHHLSARRPPCTGSSSRRILSKYDLSSIEYSTTAGEALNPEVFEQWKRATGLTLMEGFGQTETTLTVYNPVGTVPKTGSMGIPSPLYDVDIVLPDGTPRPGGRDRRNRGAHGQGRALRPVHGLLPGRGKDQGVLEATAFTTPATPPGGMRTATSGMWAAPTT